MTLTFNREQWARLLDGTKHATVRRGAVNAVRPGLTVVYTVDRREAALITITEVTTKRYDSLDIDDALKEGYESMFQLRQILESFYPDIQPYENVTVIRFSEVIWHDPSYG